MKQFLLQQLIAFFLTALRNWVNNPKLDTAIAIEKLAEKIPLSLALDMVNNLSDDVHQHDANQVIFSREIEEDSDERLLAWVQKKNLEIERRATHLRGEDY